MLWRGPHRRRPTGPGLWKSREDRGVRSEWGPAQPRVSSRRAEDGLRRGRGRAGDQGGGYRTGQGSQLGQAGRREVADSGGLGKGTVSVSRGSCNKFSQT